jgi:hypothetical protein
MAPAAVAVIHISAAWVPHGSKEIMARALTVISPITCKEPSTLQHKNIIELGKLTRRTSTVGPSPWSGFEVQIPAETCQLM